MGSTKPINLEKGSQIHKFLEKKKKIGRLKLKIGSILFKTFHNPSIENRSNTTAFERPYLCVKA